MTAGKAARCRRIGSGRFRRAAASTVALAGGQQHEEATEDIGRMAREYSASRLADGNGAAVARAADPDTVLARRRPGQSGDSSLQWSAPPTSDPANAPTSADHPRPRRGRSDYAAPAAGSGAATGLRSASRLPRRQPFRQRRMPGRAGTTGGGAARRLRAWPDLRREFAVPRRPARRRRRRAAARYQYQHRGNDDRPADVRRGRQLRRRPGRLGRVGRAELRLDPLSRPVGKTFATPRRGAAPASGSASRPCRARKSSGTWSPSRSRTCSARR